MILARRLLVRVARRFKLRSGLKQHLVSEGRTRWLDIGSSSFEDGFICLNLHSDEALGLEHANRYYQANILEMTEDDHARLGDFDLVRMQHVFEHFSWEEGSQVLSTCARLLKPDGYLLITVPDLRIAVRGYLGRYRWMNWLRQFAHRTRVPEDAPPSFIFSVFAHQVGYLPGASHGEAHRWCYDYEGLRYQVSRCGQFRSITRLGLFHPLAGYPFSHNRPDEDVCLLAQRC
jgi:SAM-dependent methyltransferase